MTKPRRTRSDSAKAAVQAHQNAAQAPIEPPVYVTLPDECKPFWDAIVTSRARDTWTAIDLCTAGNLARTQADIEFLQAELDTAGYVLADGKISPLAVLVDTLTRRSVNLSRALHVHAVATVGRSGNASKALANEKNAPAPGSDLIPTLRAV